MKKYFPKGFKTLLTSSIAHIYTPDFVLILKNNSFLIHRIPPFGTGSDVSINGEQEVRMGLYLGNRRLEWDYIWEIGGQDGCIPGEKEVWTGVYLGNRRLGWEYTYTPILTSYSPGILPSQLPIPQIYSHPNLIFPRYIPILTSHSPGILSF